MCLSSVLRLREWRMTTYNNSSVSLRETKKFRRPRNGQGRSDSYPERVLHSFLFSPRGRAHAGFDTGRHVRCFRSIWRCRNVWHRGTRIVLPGHAIFIPADFEARKGSSSTAKLDGPRGQCRSSCRRYEPRHLAPQRDNSPYRNDPRLSLKHFSKTHLS